MRKIQTNYTKYPARKLVALGDSLSLYNIGAPAHAYWPSVLARSLQGLNCGINELNLGVPGLTTLEMIGMFAAATQFGPPDLSILFGGHNDMSISGTLAAGSGNVGRTITVCLRPAMGSNNASSVGAALKHISWNGGANKATGISVTGQTATTITVTTTSGDNLPSAQTPVAIRQDTRANLKTLAELLLTKGCPRVMICSTHFQNYNGGGDNSAGNVPNAAPSPGIRLDLWNAQFGAAEDEIALHPGKVAFCDLYEAMYDVLVNPANPFYQPNKAGIDTFWHIATGNTHMNALGNQIVADAVLKTLQSQTGWLDELKK
jgi:lysophospholipase L1-like esterase